MTTESAQAVLVIGHRNPDTDAVCSALAYASFYHWQTGRETVACYLDNLAETTWPLNHLSLAPPRPISDVYLRVADVMETQVPILRPDQTLREAGQLMQLHQVRALPVVDHDRRLVGLVQNDTLAARYLDQLQLPEEVDLPTGTLQRMLEAELLAGSTDAVLNDRVWIATMTGETARASVGDGDVVIVGNQPDVQHAALASGAGCLIVTDGAPLDDVLIATATRRGAILLRTRHSPSRRRCCSSRVSRLTA
jgi:manganese-dependent inorganic pyrophosphatase